MPVDGVEGDLRRLPLVLCPACGRSFRVGSGDDALPLSPDPFDDMLFGREDDDAAFADMVSAFDAPPVDHFSPRLADEETERPRSHVADSLAELPDLDEDGDPMATSFDRRSGLFGSLGPADDGLDASLAPSLRKTAPPSGPRPKPRPMSPARLELAEDEAYAEAAANLPSSTMGPPPDAPAGGRRPERLEPPPRRRRRGQSGPVARLLKAAVAVVLLAGLAFVGWVAYKHRDALTFDTFHLLLADELDQTVESAKEAASDIAPELDTDGDGGGPIAGGPMDYYEEKVELRDGKKVIIWTPRDEAVPPHGRNPAREGDDRRGASREAPEAEKAAPSSSGGARAPALVSKDDRGRTFDLAEHRGQVVVINMYATWCPPCRHEIPAFSRFARHARGLSEPTRVYGVVFESGTAETAVRDSKKLGVDYPIVLGTPVIQKHWSVRAFPTTIVIDGEGKIVHRVTGAVDFEKLKAMVADAGAK